MIYLEKPADFKEKFRVASCFVECGEEILLLHRQDHKPQGGTWGVPAGKIEDGESEVGAIIRELREETKLIVSPQQFSTPKVVFVRYAEYDFPYYIYRLRLQIKHKIVIDPKDHSAFIWVTPAQALRMTLIQDEDACIKLCYGC